jgi:hypothetical protein
MSWIRKKNWAIQPASVFVLRTGDVQLESTGELWLVRKLQQAELPSWSIPFRRRNPKRRWRVVGEWKVI